MGTFAERPLVYQVSLLLLLLAASAFCVGLAVPWWAQSSSGVSKGVTGHSGLWVRCSLFSDSQPSEQQCGPIADAPGWLRVVQGMQSAGLVLIISACVYGLIVNFCLNRHHSSRAVEVLAGAGGLLGIVSATVYVTKTNHILKHSHGISFSWALGIDLAASILLLFIAIAIALTNRHSDVDETTKVIVEDCEGNKVKDTRSRSPEKSKRGRGAVEMERSPVRTRRLEAISEMFVSLEEEEEEEEGADQNSRHSSSYVNSVGEVAHCDPRTEAL